MSNAHRDNQTDRDRAAPEGRLYRVTVVEVKPKTKADQTYEEGVIRVEMPVWATDTEEALRVALGVFETDWEAYT